MNQPCSKQKESVYSDYRSSTANLKSANQVIANEESKENGDKTNNERKTIKVRLTKKEAPVTKEEPKVPVSIFKVKNSKESLSPSSFDSEERKEVETDRALTTAECNVATTNAVQGETDSPKTVSVTSGVLEKIGEDWKTSILIAHVVQINHDITLLSFRRYIRLAYLMLTMVGLIAYMIFYILMHKNDSFFLYHRIINIIIMVFDGIIMVGISVKFRFAYLHRQLNRNFSILHASIATIYYLLCLFMAITFLSKKKYLLALGYASSFYGTDLIHSIRITLLIIVAPFISLVFLFEFVARAVTCKLACPYMRLKTSTYTYKLYKYGEENTKNETACSICLCPFDDEDRDLIVLLCLKKHVFHEACLLEWLKRQEYCPVCRSEIIFSV
eukprot:TRINITY_DN3825_c0_g1_i7.p1 TRINITY_DN3825_c0_g1~~TRINITY_DN3825_c0_g1_i7.p1  ORF type:complete len:387 (+),score=76.00 TRINITY_DN3825_c0_g1_i7:132-1292(+)